MKTSLPQACRPKPLHLTECLTTTIRVLLLTYQPTEQGRQEGQLP
jgi:hypothetical protein